MERVLIKLSILWVAIALIQMHGYKCCLENERIALLELKAFFKSVSEFDTNNILASWVDDKMSDCCGWEQVKCNATTGRVEELLLNDTRKSSYSSSDRFPVLNFSLFHPFEELRRLDLSGNSLAGWDNKKAYAHGIGSLNQLNLLNLAYNEIDNSFLPYLNTLTSLTTLNLRANAIKGFIPKEGLGNLTNLGILDLSSNLIRGFLSGGLSNLQNLKVLDLSYNNINGSLARLGLGNLRNLEALSIRSNFIYGSLGNKGICELNNLIEMDLSKNNFDGHVPQCFSNLTNLKVLDLSSNQLSGNLPSVVIANLKSLEYLALSHNKFGGVFFFSSLANLSKLEVLTLSTQNKTLRLEDENWLPTYHLKLLQLSNLIFHSIPSFLIHQYNLQFVDLSHNGLVGAFPTWLLKNNTKLQSMHLVNNSLTGILQLPKSKHDLLQLDISNNNFNDQLPKDIGMTLSNLELLNISRNNFKGKLPSSIVDIIRLEILDLSSNNFSGELPSNFLIDCFSLKFLKLSDNSFHGQIFPQFMNLTSMTWLFLENNHFNGKIGEGLSNSSFLVVLDISNNKVSGEIPHWIGNFSHLRILLMSKNLLQGNIPVQLSNLKNIELLDISENRLSGSMPSSLNLSSLKQLFMQNNAINGTIPDALFKSSNLEVVDMRDNEFSGSNPDWIIEHSNLRVLLLGGNHLQSHILEQLCQLRNLSILDLSHNKLDGTIPSCLTKMLPWMAGDEMRHEIRYEYFLFFVGTSSFDRFYNFTLDIMPIQDIYRVTYQRLNVKFTSKNRYESYEGSILNYLNGLDLSRNHLTGVIPSEVGDLQKIHALNLSHNSFFGSIPESFSHLQKIESLDLSYNKLNGQIPPQLIELNTLQIFNVSYNNLSGPIPNNWQFGSFDESTYLGNPSLCGSLIKKSCDDAPTPTSSPSSGEKGYALAIDMVAFQWSFIASYVTVLLGLLVILWINLYWRSQWFCFIDACIDSCFHLFSNAFLAVIMKFRP